MLNFKKIKKIDKALGIAALLTTAAYAIGMGIYELVQKLQPAEPEESHDIEVEVFEENEDSGVDAETDDSQEPTLYEDTVGEVDDNEVVDFEESDK